jgi:hypothetical protein
VNQHNTENAGLPQPARRLIAGVASLASLILLSALLKWTNHNVLQLAVWLAAAAVSGTVKLRFPKVEGSFSLGYFVVLAVIAALDFPETVAFCMVIPAVQCYWRPLKRPVPVQVLFNISNYVLSGACAWLAYHALEHLPADPGLAAHLALAAAVFFLANTGLVSWILSMVSGRRLSDIWENSFLLVFPYYLAGAACAGVFAWKTDAPILLAAVPALFLLGLLYASTRAWVRKLT